MRPDMQSPGARPPRHAAEVPAPGARVPPPRPGPAAAPTTATPRRPGPGNAALPTEPIRAHRNPAPIPADASADHPVADRTAGDKDPPASAGADTGIRRRLPVLRNMHRVVWRTIVKSWDDGIIGWAAQAAFWQALSLPPLLLGLLGSVGYIAGWFGPDTVDVIYQRILSFSERTFSANVVDDLIRPTVDNVLGRGRVGLISLGFIMSLWAGSSAVSCFVAAIAQAHGQEDVRNPVWQRIFALLVYIGFLAVSVPLLPLVALGPNYLREIVPASWGPLVTSLIDYGYFPFVAVLLLLVLTTLYHLALPNPLPWHRLVGGAVVAGIFFWIAGYVLRIYLAEITRSGYTYGALATPIAFLLFTFFLGFAIVLGAEFNAAVQSMWPAKPPASAQVRDWVYNQATDFTGQLRTLPERLSSGPIRRHRDDGPS
ncbi:hypothetical protein GCM10009624_10180 [Gordonia sinesedis]